MAPGGQDALGVHGLLEDRAAGRPDQRAVEVDEDGTGGSGMPSRYRRADGRPASVTVTAVPDRPETDRP